MPKNDINVIFENDDLFIINKPAGLSFHSEDRTPGVAVQSQELSGYNLWPVHRLDKITSGLLMFAKNKDAAKLINQLFKRGQIQKTYIALSANKPKKKQGKIIGDMVKTRNGNWKLTHEKQNPAVTLFYSSSLCPGVRFFWVTPQTGKTHQIRVALKSVGAAILGDARYAGANADRGYLHAYRLRFNWKGKDISVCCAPDEGEYFLLPELKECIQKFENQSLFKPQ